MLMILQAPTRVLDSLQRHRDAGAAVGTTLYSVRAGHLVQAETARRAAGWSCRLPACDRDPQCIVVLTDDDLSTALDPAVLSTTGHLDPATHLTAYRAAWRSQVWQRIGGRAGELADQLSGDLGPGMRVQFDTVQVRRYTLAARMVSAGFRMTLSKLTRAGLLQHLPDEHAVLLTLPPVRVETLSNPPSDADGITGHGRGLPDGPNRSPARAVRA